MANDSLKKTISLLIQTDTKSFDSSMQSMQSKMHSTASASSLLESRLSGIINSTNTLNSTAQNSSNGVNKLGTSFNTLGKGAESATNGITSATSGLSDLSGTIVKATSALGVLGGAITTLAIKKASDLEFTIASLNKVLSTQERELLPDIIEGVKALSIEYGKSEKEIVEAVTVFKQAGFSVTEAAKLQKVALDFAIAGNIEAAESATYLTQVIQGFRVPYEEAGDVAVHFADAMNEVSNRTAASADKIAQAVSILSPIAKSAGFSFDETIGLVTPIIEVFGSGHEAAIALKTGLLKLTDDTAPLQRELNKLNISQFDVNGNMRSAKDIFLDVAKSFETMEESNKNFITQALVGIDQAARMSTVFDQLSKVINVTDIAVNSSAGGFNKFNNEIRPVGSAVNEVSIKLETTKTAIDRASSSFDILVTSFGNQFLGSVFKVSEGVVGLNTNLTKMLESAGSNSSVIKLINQLFDDLYKEIVSLSSVLPEALAGLDFTKVTDNILDLREVFLGIFKVDNEVDRVAQVQAVLQGIVDTTASFIKVTEGILSTLISYVTEYLYPLIDGFNNMDDASKSLTGNFLGTATVINKVSSVVSGVTSAINFLATGITVLAGVLGVKLLGSLALATGGFTALTAASGAFLTSVVAQGAGVGVLSASMAALGASISGVISVISGGLLGALGAAAAAIAAVYYGVEKLKDSNNDFSDFLSDFVSAPLTYLGIWDTVEDKIEQARLTQEKAIEEFEELNGSIQKVNHSLKTHSTELEVTSKSTSEITELEKRLSNIQAQLNKETNTNSELLKLNNTLRFNATKIRENEVAIQAKEIEALNSLNSITKESNALGEQGGNVDSQIANLERLVEIKSEVSELLTQINSIDVNSDVESSRLVGIQETLNALIAEKKTLEKEYQGVLESSPLSALYNSYYQQLLDISDLKKEQNELSKVEASLQQDIESLIKEGKTSREELLISQEKAASAALEREREIISESEKRTEILNTIRDLNSTLLELQNLSANTLDSSTKSLQIMAELSGNELAIEDAKLGLLTSQRNLLEESASIRAKVVNETSNLAEVELVTSNLAQQNTLLKEIATIEDTIQKYRTELAAMDSGEESLTTRKELVQEIQELTSKQIEATNELNSLSVVPELEDSLNRRRELVLEINQATSILNKTQERGSVLETELQSIRENSASTLTKANVDSQLAIAEANKEAEIQKLILTEVGDINARNIAITRNGLELGEIQNQILVAESEGQAKVVEILKEREVAINDNLSALTRLNKASEERIDLIIQEGVGVESVTDSIRESIVSQTVLNSNKREEVSVASELKRQLEVLNEIKALSNKVDEENYNLSLLRNEAAVSSGAKLVTIETEIASAIEYVNSLTNRQVELKEESAQLDEKVKGIIIGNLNNQISLQEDYNSLIKETDFGKVLNYTSQLSQAQITLGNELIGAEANTENLRKALELLAERSGVSLLNLSDTVKNEMLSLIDTSEGVINSIDNITAESLDKQAAALNTLTLAQIEYIRTILGEAANPENLEQALVIAASRIGTTIDKLTIEQQNSLVEVTDGTITKIGEITDNFLITQEKRNIKSLENLSSAQQDAVSTVSLKYDTLIAAQDKARNSLAESEKERSEALLNNSKETRDKITESENEKAEALISIEDELKSNIVQLNEEKAEKIREIDNNIVTNRNELSKSEAEAYLNLRDELLSIETDFRDTLKSLSEERLAIEDTYAKNRLEIQNSFKEQYLSVESDISSSVIDELSSRVKDTKENISNLQREIFDDEIDSIVSETISSLEDAEVTVPIDVDVDLKIKNLEDDLSTLIVSELTKANDGIQNAKDSLKSNVSEIYANLSDEITKIQETQSKSIENLEQESSNTITEINNTKAETLKAIQAEYSNSTLNSQKELADSIKAIQKELAESTESIETDLENDLVKLKDSYQNTVVELESTAAERIVEIREELSEISEKLDSSYGDSKVEVVKETENEINEVLSESLREKAELEESYLDDITEAYKDNRDTIVSALQSSLDREISEYESYKDSVLGIQDTIADETVRQREKLVGSEASSSSDVANNNRLEREVNTLTNEFNAAIADNDFVLAESLARQQESFVDDMSDSISVRGQTVDVDKSKLYSQSFERLNQALEGQLEQQTAIADTQSRDVERVSNTISSISEGSGQLSSAELNRIERIGDVELSAAVSLSESDTSAAVSDLNRQLQSDLESVDLSTQVSISTTSLEDGVEDSYTSLNVRRQELESELASIESSLQSDLYNERVSYDNDVNNLRTTASEEISRVENNAAASISESRLEYNESIRQSEIDRVNAVSNASIEAENSLQSLRESNAASLAAIDTLADEDTSNARSSANEAILSEYENLNSSIESINSERQNNILQAESDTSDAIAQIHSERESEISDTIVDSRTSALNDSKITDALDTLQSKFSGSFDSFKIEDGVARIDFSKAESIVSAQEELASLLSDDSYDLTIKSNLDTITSKRKSELAGLERGEIEYLNTLESGLSSAGSTFEATINSALTSLGDIPIEDSAARTDVIESLRSNLTKLSDSYGVDISGNIDSIIDSLYDLNEAQSSSVKENSDLYSSELSNISTSISEAYETLNESQVNAKKSTADLISELREESKATESDLKDEKDSLESEYSEKILELTRESEERRNEIIQEYAQNKVDIISDSEAKATEILESEVSKRQGILNKLSSAITTFESGVNKQISGAKGKEGIKGLTSQELVDLAVDKSEANKQASTPSGGEVKLNIPNIEIDSFTDSSGTSGQIGVSSPLSTQINNLSTSINNIGRSSNSLATSAETFSSSVTSGGVKSSALKASTTTTDVSGDVLTSSLSTATTVEGNTISTSLESISNDIGEMLNIINTNSSSGDNRVDVSVNLTGAQHELEIFVEKLIKLARFNAVYKGSEFLLGT